MNVSSFIRHAANSMVNYTSRPRLGSSGQSLASRSHGFARVPLLLTTALAITPFLTEQGCPSDDDDSSITPTPTQTPLPDSCDLSGTNNTTVATGTFPKVDSTTLYWSATDEPGSPIYRLNVKTADALPEKVTTDPGIYDIGDYDVKGSILVYDDKTNGTEDLYGVNLETLQTFQLTKSPETSDRFPSISYSEEYGYWLMWGDYDNWLPMLAPLTIETDGSIQLGASSTVELEGYYYPYEQALNYPWIFYVVDDHTQNPDGTFQIHFNLLNVETGVETTVYSEGTELGYIYGPDMDGPPEGPIAVFESDREMYSYDVRTATVTLLTTDGDPALRNYDPTVAYDKAMSTWYAGWSQYYYTDEGITLWTDLIFYNPLCDEPAISLVGHDFQEDHRYPDISSAGMLTWTNLSDSLMEGDVTYREF